MIARAVAAPPPVPALEPKIPEEATSVRGITVFRGGLVAVGEAGNVGFVASPLGGFPTATSPTAVAAGKTLVVAAASATGGSAWFTELEPDLSTKWRTAVPAEVDKHPVGIVPLSRGYLACGNENPLQPGVLFGWLARLARDGSLDWEISLGGASYDQFHACTERDGLVVAVGSIGALTSSDAWIVGLSPKNGAIAWDVRPSDKEAYTRRDTWTVARAVIPDPTGFLVVGHHAAVRDGSDRGEPFLWQVHPEKGAITVLHAAAGPEPLSVTGVSREGNGAVWMVANGQRGGWLGSWDGTTVRWSPLDLARVWTVATDAGALWVGGEGRDGKARLLRLR